MWGGLGGGLGQGAIRSAGGASGSMRPHQPAASAQPAAGRGGRTVARSPQLLMAAEEEAEEENVDETEAREFGKTDRDNIESKRQRLRVLSSPVMVTVTVEQLSAACRQVPSSSGRIVLEAARDVFVKVSHLPPARLIFIGRSRRATAACGATFSKQGSAVANSSSRRPSFASSTARK